MLDLIDDEPTGIEGFAPVHRTHAHPYGHVGQTQCADAVDAQGAFDRKSTLSLRKNAFAFLHRQLLESLVFQPSDLLSLVVIANPALEADVAAGTGIEQLEPRRNGVDGRMRETKAHQPPATGGMNTTASPDTSLRDHVENSLLTATFNCSWDNVKP